MLAQPVSGRCRLCTANGHEVLQEQLAADLWEKGRYETLDDVPWPEAGDHWHRLFRQLAAEAIASLTHV